MTEKENPLDINEQIRKVKEKDIVESHAAHENPKYGYLQDVLNRLAAIKTNVQLGDMKFSAEEWQEFIDAYHQNVEEMQIVAEPEEPVNEEFKDSSVVRGGTKKESIRAALAKIEEELEKIRKLISK